MPPQGYGLNVLRAASRRSRAQHMHTASVRVTGARWNRPCLLEEVCGRSPFCICNRAVIRRLHSRACNRVACSFLKWCRALARYREEDPPFRSKWGAPGKLTYPPRFLRGFRQPFRMR